MKKLMIMAVAAVATGLAAMAGTPASFAYQGVLRDEAGNRLAQEQATITFRLYDAATDGNKLWEKQLSVALDTNGLFNVELSGVNLADVIAKNEEAGKSLYIGLTVKDSAGEISPRQKLISTPLAAYAQNVAKADGDFTVAGATQFKGAVTLSSSNSTFTAYGSADVRGGLDVTRKAGLWGGAEVSKGLKVSGGAEVSDGLTVNGVQVNLPIGAIIMWAGAADDVPPGWLLCNGQAWPQETSDKYIGTDATNKRVPDLSGRFIVGVGTSEGVTYEPGMTGGTNEVRLAINEMPKHDHEIVFGQRGYHAETSSAYAPHETVHDKDHDWTKTTESAGGNVPHENRPPFYALCYIIKVK